MGKNQKKKQQKNQGSKVNKSSKYGGSPLKGGKLAASHILVKKLSLAQQIRDDITAGKKFEELARKYSECPSKKRGGNLGEFGKEKMIPEFWNACVKLKVGQISEPVKTSQGYHIIKRTK
ncbi:MAG: peptidylprolyl isomerase [Promethearchaeota archaeon]